MIRDVCDKGSSFHSDYVANVNCYREYFKGPVENCGENITKLVEEFFDQLYADENIYNTSSEIYSQLSCLIDVYEVVCIIDNLGEACGNIAQRQAQEVLKRMKGLYEESPCKNILDSTNLKTMFLDFLKLDEQRRSNLQGIFDLIKRRR
ncbi:hypothetical protein HNY73_016158 [Argiope bruennichi]|uniref:Uncharacterized protein n=1 Tax=Argiope bruennichi TaxID=94029 RepID=A0A8T0EMQ9_ARGBR|nr:hypothetical protein HNY73_016158 [Argiope bruennichi]